MNDGTIIIHLYILLSTGIYFQDDRMAEMFKHFPELILFDATYKLNNRDMPLVLQLCVDGNGETEIVSLYVCNSESTMSIGCMLDAFQEFNEDWRKTQVIIGDKDFADRAIYKQKFPDAELQICLFHVLCTFKREITPEKRNITAAEKNNVLQILEKLAYSRSSHEYESLYQQLLSLNMESVTDYYNTNWHNIKQEWTLFGRNQHSNYLNTTNNRTESLNQKIKMISCRHSNLTRFFENIFITVSVTASEKDIRAVRLTMKTPRQRFDDENLVK